MGNPIIPIRIENHSGLESKEELLTINAKPSIRERQDLCLNSPEDVLELLKSDPDGQSLGRGLRWLKTSGGRQDQFNVLKPGAKAAQIVFVLVNSIIPNYWTSFLEKSTSKSPIEKRMLVQCLRSVAGIGALTSRLRLLVGQLKDSQNRSEVEKTNKVQSLEEVLDVMENVLEGNQFCSLIWNDITTCISQPSQKFLQWKEFLSLVASGRVLSLVSESIIALNELDSSVVAGRWTGDGNQYAFWLGQNIQAMIKTLPDNDVEGRKATSKLLSKALSLGYADQVVQASCSDLVNGDETPMARTKIILGILASNEQKTLLYALIRLLSRDLSSEADNSIRSGGKYEDEAIAGVAALLAALIHEDPHLLDLMISWLIGTSAEAVGQGHRAHRAVILTLCKDFKQINKALHMSLELFGDKLYIKHTPILHQEVNAQIALMLAGYAYREDKNNLLRLSRTSVYLNAISNRLAASSERGRFLGMIVGNAVSELVDPVDKRMNFSSDDMSNPEGRWYKSLTSINDAVGVISDLKASTVSSTKSLATRTKTGFGKEVPDQAPISAKASSKIISIEKINDSSESEAEDLPSYEKPDSDPSDEDDDPTLVQRDRPTAPVYIRDLIAGLRDTENFDRQKLALSAASNLIRRKASFGTEVSDDIIEIATLLVGLSDRWEMEDFQKMRLQGMIAVLTAKPLKMGQWFSMTFYNGDYSMGQRVSVLTTLGLGARELAGLGKEDAALTGVNPAETSFPSKRLPDKLHKLYALEAAPMTAISQQLERTMIQSMAAEAADKVTGPNVLKVRTFSSRMAVEKKRQKPIPNALAKIVAEGFFFPLTGRWRIHLQSYGESTSHTSPFLLSHLLKTLSLILHASGTSTLSLPQMTSEFWDLLLSLRPRGEDPSILEALLFSFLTLLDVNGNDQRRVAEMHAKELLETQGWVENVFERVGGGSKEGDQIRMLAAGVLMRTREVVEKYQRLLMGDLVDFM